MKNQILLRGLLGIPVGISVSFITSIIISIIIADGHYYPCVPQLIEIMGSEIGAVVFQTILTIILGVSFAISSVIWEMDNWSIAKQTGIYFVITSAILLPISYFNNWMEQSLTGALSYFGIFVVLFILVWLSRYFIMRRKINEIRKRLN